MSRGVARHHSHLLQVTELQQERVTDTTTRALDKPIGLVSLDPSEQSLKSSHRSSLTGARSAGAWSTSHPTSYDHDGKKLYQSFRLQEHWKILSSLAKKIEKAGVEG